MSFAPELQIRATGDPASPSTISHALIAVWCLAACGLVLTVLRLYTRSFVVKQFGLDDAFIACAMICTIAYTAMATIAQRTYGVDDPTSNIPADIIIGTRPLQIWLNAIHLISANLIHASWMSFDYRIAKDTGIIWFRNVLNICIASIMALFAIFLGLVIKFCQPFAKYQVVSPTDHDRCLRRAEVAMAGGVVKTGIDVILILLPYPLLLSLTMRNSHRWILLTFLSLSVLEVAAGCARLYYTYEMFFGDRKSPGTFGYTIGSLEHNLGVICACIPFISSLFTKSIPRVANAIRKTVVKNALSSEATPTPKNLPAAALTTQLAQPVDPVDRIWPTDDESIIRVK